jgi:hypothetical protein
MPCAARVLLTFASTVYFVLAYDGSRLESHGWNRGTQLGRGGTYALLGQVLNELVPASPIFCCPQWVGGESSGAASAVKLDIRSARRTGHGTPI